MGRGGRQLPALALDPLAPPPVQTWLDSFTKFEQEAFHGEMPGEDAFSGGAPGCDITYPYSAPRFVAMRTPNNVSNLHTFDYYTSPDDLLTSLLSSIRTFRPYLTSLIEYQPDGARFVEVYLNGALKTVFPESGNSTAPAGLSSEQLAKARVERARAIATPHNLPLHTSANYGQGRFLLVRRGLEGLHFTLIGSVDDLAHWVGIVAVNSFAFEGIYDLDESDQPVPVRLALRYASSDGIVHEVAEGD